MGDSVLTDYLNWSQIVHYTEGEYTGVDSRETSTHDSVSSSGLFEVASLALLTYDYVLTLRTEVELVWRSRWSFGSVLFLLTRYTTFAGSILKIIYSQRSDLFEKHLCGTLYRSSIYVMIGSVIMIEVIIVMRVYALWGRSRRMLVCLVGLTSCTIVSTLVVFFISQEDNTWVENPIPRLGSCIFLSLNVANSLRVYGVFIALMIFQFVLIVLTLWKGIAQWRLMNRRSHLLKIFYRDGIFYFVSLSLANCLNIVYSKDAIIYLIEPQRVVQSILATRMIINLREAHMINRQEGTPADTLASFVQASVPASTSGPSRDGL
ncbi:hypothetical protein A7U60_g4577 [Sanghuangporus baumii]|uniref:DUF6533 domain-containing protein n=1 Tax=Sanghuangporus baumii TaxID=108892 RepID=A0A9Q5N911_SANBA|nr:hypothetical protein A7U60_g4577 [Sanghuangporus baumii]